VTSAPHDTDNIDGPTSSTLCVGMFTLSTGCRPYGRRVPGPRENRAAVFTSSSQDVEVYRDGSWLPGSLLGWRHEDDGSCQAWVRTSQGTDDTAWLALDYLRLPQPEPRRTATTISPLATTVPTPSTDAVLTGTMAAIRAVPAPTRGVGGRRERSELTATMNLFAVRDLATEDGAPATSPPAASAPSVPATTARPARSGGRRRAPETAEIDVLVAPAAGGPAVAGRHRAPAPAAGAAGRHRAADTGVWPAVRADAPAVAAPPAQRADEPDAHLFTRPMRLGDLVGGPGAGGIPRPRRPSARNGRLTEV
jgi:hypothetical protein